MPGGCLPPHPVILPGLEVSIRIVEGQEVPVQLIQELGVLRPILQELVEHPGVDCGRDPLPGVDAAVYPHCWLAAASALADL